MCKMKKEILFKFYETFKIKKVYYCWINIGDLDNNYKIETSRNLKTLYDNSENYLDTWVSYRTFKEKCKNNLRYPKITDNTYLRLLHLIFSKSKGIELNQEIPLSYDEFKEFILLQAIELKDIIKKEVKEIFKTVKDIEE